MKSINFSYIFHFFGGLFYLQATWILWVHGKLVSFGNVVEGINALILGLIFFVLGIPLLLTPLIFRRKRGDLERFPELIGILILNYILIFIFSTK